MNSFGTSPGAHVRNLSDYISLGTRASSLCSGADAIETGGDSAHD